MSNTPSDISSPALPTRQGTFALVDLHSGRVYSLQPGPNSIGRSDKCRVVLDGHEVSRRHAVLMVHETGECEVSDAESRNGVFLNGRRLRGVARLKAGDVLRICGFRLLLTKTTPSNPTPFAFTDETLGVVVWNAVDACWHFSITLGVDWFVPAVYSPSDYTPPDRVPPTTAPEWNAVRACFRHVKAREADARALVVEEWGSQTRAFRPNLEQVLFTTTNATFVYEEVYGVYCVTIDPTGAFLSGPKWISHQSDNDD